MKKNGLERKKWIGLMGYAFLISFLIANVASKGQYEHFVTTRVECLQKYIDYLTNNGPRPNISDTGANLYYFLGPLSVKLGIYSAADCYVWIKVLLTSILTFIYPLCFYALYKKIYLAIIAPIVLYLFSASTLFFPMTDSTWIMEWIVLISVPLLVLCKKCLVMEKKIIAGALFATLCLASGISNLFRMHSGTIVIVVSLIYIFMGRKIYIKELIVRLMAAIIGLYLFIDIIPWINQNIFGAEKYGFEMMSGWHTIFIGIGWEENPWGIYYMDECGMEFAPDVKYNSKEYLNVLKEKTIELVKENPVWFMKSYLKKEIVAWIFAFVCAATSTVISKTPIIYICINLIGAIYILWNVVRDKKLFKILKDNIFILTIAMMSGSIFALIAIPKPFYINVMVGIIHMVEIFILLKIIDGKYYENKRGKETYVSN